MPDRKSTAGDKPKLSTILDETERRLSEAQEQLNQGRDEIARAKKILGDLPKQKP